MARRKEAMARARKRRRRRDGDLTLNDDHIVTLIREMKKAAEVRGEAGGGMTHA